MFESSIAMRIVEVATSAGLATLAIFLILRKYLVRGANVELQAEIERARAEASLQARQEAFRFREELDEEARLQRATMEKLQANLMERDAQLEVRRESLAQKELDLSLQSSELVCREHALNKRSKELHERLSMASGIDRAAAKELFLKQIEEEFREVGMARAREIEQLSAGDAEKRAAAIVLGAMERCAASSVAEATVSVVTLATEDLKGRIIGREGRNIRAFELITGVDLIIDDTPESVTLSSFDPVRREGARLTLLSLLEDGRIHPANIEEHYEKAKTAVQRTIKEAGDDAAQRALVSGLNPSVLETMGRLRFRTSFAQNVLDHSVETAHLAATIATELGLDAELARKSGFLHDIGKALGSEQAGPHALVGMEYLRREGLREPLLNAVGAHHREIEPESPEAQVVIVADALSAARPGARRESLDSYVQRLSALEKLADGFTGVERSFAVQAGREIRVLVKPDEIDDLAAARLASQIARQIEAEMQYPGQIRVTVIRETRVQEIAK